ncbi:MAG: GGDEF domain-containing protein [Nakamurella sp.]
MQELGSTGLNRWSLRLTDVAQERRFNEFTLRTERLTILATAIVIAGLDVAAVVTGLASPGTFTTTDAAIHVIILLLLATAGSLMWWSRSGHAMGYLIGTTVALFAVVTIMISTSEGMAFGGALLLLAGVMLLYLAGRFNLIIITFLALLYTACVMPAWLSATPPPPHSEVLFTVIVIVAAHIFGFAEARRTQRERRILFAQQELLSEQSRTDELTGLINRREFRTQLDHAWTRWKKTGAPMAVVMLDLDHFKLFNDTFGHPAGDVALRLVGDAIDTCLIPADGQLGARYGGEEFMCLLPAETLPEATAVAERIRLAIYQLQLRMARPDGAMTATLTVSAGVALPDTSMRHVGDLLQAVDDQLYRAKDAGRDCIRPETHTHQRR